ncbi:alpha/beta hydrolase [Fluviicoccus keumensis]|nr:alpha/beta fold hydrolase [Fluviicoccus keumensis]
MPETTQASGPAGPLETRLTLPPKPEKGQVAVICHPHPLYGGTMDNKVVSTLARACLERGLPVVTFNFRGVGASAGVHDHGVGEVGDCLAVIDWAAQQTGADQVVLAGFSFGSYIAAAASSRLPPGQVLRQLMLIAPPVHHYPFTSLALPPETLVVQGEADEVVPPEAVFVWAEQAGLPVVRLPGCSHFFHGRLTELKQIVVEKLS